MRNRSYNGVSGVSHTSEWPTQEGQSLANQFISAGIDDLAKFHLVQLFCERQSLVADAAFYAASLGFHSVELTTALLDELAERGILAKECSEGWHRVQYRLADDRELRLRVVALYRSIHWSEEREAVLSTLATRSINKARARANALRRRGCAGTGRKAPGLLVQSTPSADYWWQQRRAVTAE